jgi:hypothetical protein
MSSANIIVILVVIAAIALVVFLIIRNKKDRRELINPDATDPLGQEKREQKRGEDQL